jgi:hypothetical protein
VLWHKSSTALGWSGWEALGGGCASRPEVVSWGPDRLDVFVVGEDGDLWHKWWDGSKWGPSWTEWATLGGAASGS